MQPALQDEPRRSGGALGPSLAENRPNADPEISGQTAFRYPALKVKQKKKKKNLLLLGVRSQERLEEALKPRPRPSLIRRLPEVGLADGGLDRAP